VTIILTHQILDNLDNLAKLNDSNFSQIFTHGMLFNVAR